MVASNDELNAILDGAFAFKIGDILVHKGGQVTLAGEPDATERSLFADNRFSRLVVTARVLDQCSGGVQRHYHVRVVDAKGGFTPSTYDLLEEELLPAPIAPARAQEATS